MGVPGLIHERVVAYRPLDQTPHHIKKKTEILPADSGRGIAMRNGIAGRSKLPQALIIVLLRKAKGNEVLDEGLGASLLCPP